MNNYTQINILERAKIFNFKKAGYSNNLIAELLGRNKSTISREICRNSDSVGYLYPSEAQATTDRRKARHGTKIKRIEGLKEYIIKKLNSHWAPGAIAGRWSKQFPEGSITAESIYSFIYSKEVRDMALWKLLPRKKQKRGLVRKTNKGSSILHRVSIALRPEHIALRTEPGHFEADLFFNKGSMSSNVLNLVDRRSRMTILVKNDSKHSEPIIDHIDRTIGSIAKTVTFDNGKEFAMHNRLQERRKIKTFFCNPGSPWQKGSVENSNGALRRYLPFQLPARSITQETLNSVAEIINNIPRKSLGFLTPAEVFHQDYNQNFSSVALHI